MSFPLLASLVGHPVKLESLLLVVEILSGILGAHERHAYLHLYLLARLGLVGEVDPYVVARHLLGIA